MIGFKKGYLFFKLMLEFNAVSYIEDNPRRNEWLAKRNKRKVDAFRDVSRIYGVIGKDLGDKPRVLDIGTGNGYFVNTAREIGYEVYGLDLSSAFDLSKSEDGDNRFIIANASKLPFLDNSFDLVYESMFFSDILDFQEGKEENFKIFLDEIARVTKPNGFYVGMMEFEWLRETKTFIRMGYSDNSMGFYRRNEPDYSGGIGLTLMSCLKKYTSNRKE